MSAAHTVLVIGGGPAGLRAAEVANAAGARVTVCDGQRSVGRKFLVAGRGGLNLTHGEPVENFPARYLTEPERWRDLFQEFGPDHLRAWAAELGIETYVGTSGRVFPRGQKAAALLRAWLRRLRASGVQFRTGSRFVGLTRETGAWCGEFQNAEDSFTLAADAVVLALGGASRPETGSDGTWPAILAAHGIEIAPWQPANCGWEVDWPAELLARTEGMPLKNLEVRAGNESVSGELLITRHGLEGGAIYRLGPTLRSQLSHGPNDPDPNPLPQGEGVGTPALSAVGSFSPWEKVRMRARAEARLEIDFKPQLTAQALRNRVSQLTDAQEWFRAWKLSKAAAALLETLFPADCTERERLIMRLKNFPLALRGPRPIAEAISSAGGVRWSELDDALMLRKLPGVFVAGEMIDWEAPTGGYLLQGCFATGNRAGREAAVSRAVDRALRAR